MAHRIAYKFMHFLFILRDLRRHCPQSRRGSPVLLMFAGRKGRKSYGGYKGTVRGN